jgi:group I intron endonuclease
MAYIYRILNKITQKCYIGESKCLNINRRWNQHKKTIENNKGYCPALRDAVIKYGIENFIFTVIIVCFDDDRFKYEKEYINKYNSVVPNGYNVTNGGEGGGGFQGKKHSDEVKNKIKNTLKQKYIDNPELKKKLSERNKIVLNIPEVKERIKLGILNSDKYQKAIRASTTNDVKRKISEGLKKYHNENKIKPIKIKQYDNNNNLLNEYTSRAPRAPTTNDVKIKISEGLKKYHNENKIKPIKIKQYDNNNNLLNEYTTISEASKESSVTRKAISLYLREKTKTAGGFIWKYV